MTIDSMDPERNWPEEHEIDSHPLHPDDAFALMCMTAHRLSMLVDQPWSFQKEKIPERLPRLLDEFTRYAEVVGKALEEWGYLK